MMENAGADRGGSDRHSNALTIVLLYLRTRIQRLINCHVHQMQWHALYPKKGVLGYADTVGKFGRCRSGVMLYFSVGAALQPLETWPILFLFDIVVRNRLCYALLERLEAIRI